MVINKVINRLDPCKKRYKEKEARINLEKHGYTGIIGTAENNAIPPQYFDLWTLVKEINRVKPRFVLEYGSGYSTCVIAETLRRLGHEWRFLSVELDEGWKAVTRSRLDQALQERVEFISPRSEMWLYGSNSLSKGGLWFRSEKGGKNQFGIATISFPELHVLEPDFIYLDGPSANSIDGFKDFQGQPFKPMVCDPLFIRSAYTMVVDSRRANCAFLAANYNRPFRVKKHHANCFSVFDVSAVNSRDR